MNTCLCGKDLDAGVVVRPPIPCYPQLQGLLSKHPGNRQHYKMVQAQEGLSIVMPLSFLFPSYWLFNQSEHQLMILSDPFD